MCEEECKARHSNVRSELHQLSTNRMKQCVEGIIGTEEEFRNNVVVDAKYEKLVELVAELHINMKDAKYKKLVELFGRRLYNRRLILFGSMH